jgi:hypothetical protein
MKTSKILFYINLGFAIFLGIGWVYFYSFIILDDISRMPRALTRNAAITELNVLFLISLVLLPLTYRHGKHRNEIRK